MTPIKVPIKVKCFECKTLDSLQDKINYFTCEEIEDCDVVDIKFHVDQPIDLDLKDMGICEMYIAMILYR